MPSWEVLVNPPSACPGCVAAAGQPWPAHTTSRYCRRCLAQLRRSVQCHIWNADRAHQVAAGKARAAQFTPESQAAAGHASFAAFSARWRAEQGLAPLSAADAQRYVTLDMIRSLIGIPLAPALQKAIWRAWCFGLLLGDAVWLSDDYDPPPDPQGLWADALGNLEVPNMPSKTEAEM
jgi:hypothetical protein